MDFNKKSSFLIRDILTPNEDKSETNSSKAEEDSDSEHRVCGNEGDDPIDDMNQLSDQREYDSNG